MSQIPVGVLKTIKISDIQENPEALRQVNRGTPAYKGLVDSIREVGVLKAINVNEVPSRDDPNKIVYGLIDGAHRFNAAQDANLKEIPAMVLDVDQGKALQLQLMANVHKVETKPSEYSDGLLRILSSNPTMTRNDLARELAKSPKWLDDRLSITKLIPEAQALVDENRLNLTNAYALAKLKDPEEQRNFLDRAQTEEPKIFAPLVQTRVTELNKAKNAGKTADPETFRAVAHQRTLKEIEADIASKAAAEVHKAKGLIQNTDDFIAGLKWALHLDPDSIVDMEEKWKGKKLERAETKRKKEIEKAKEDKEKAEKILAAAGHTAAAAALTA